MIPLDSISFEEIDRVLNKAVADDFLKYANIDLSGIEKRFPSELWLVLIEAIKTLRHNCVEPLEQLEQKRQIQQDKTESRVKENLAEQKDSIGLALDIFKADRAAELTKWTPPAKEREDVPPFLEGLEAANVLEDTIVGHDAQVFGDWYKDQDKSYQIGVATFLKQGQRLSVMNVNRTPVEKALGVDLLYYHHQFQAYIMVQYKRMILKSKEFRFQLPKPDNLEDSYNKEIRAMEEFERTYPMEPSDIKALGDYRLYPGTFYFKLCQALNFDPLSPDLTPGMYIPLDYWQHLIRSQQVLGPQGGISITKDNVGRYLNNTLFVQLAQSGWIGSRIGNKAILSTIICEALKNKRSVTLAVSQAD
jgi:hypothetical protein